MRKLIELFKKINSKKGQSILEFALIFPFIVFFIFMVVQVCITYIGAEYINYVSFMSARSVLTNGHLTDKHIRVVQRYVPAQMKNLFRVNNPNLINYQEGTRQFVGGTKRIESGSQLNDQRGMGVEIEYSIPVFMPFLREFGESLRFKTRTVLGREPYHGGEAVQPWFTGEPRYGDSFGDASACGSVFNDNGC